jgi:hypothetical protein
MPVFVVVAPKRADYMTAELSPSRDDFCGPFPDGCPSAEASGPLPFTFRLDRCGTATFDQRTTRVKG